MKRLILIAIAVLVVLSYVPASVHAQNTTPLPAVSVTREEPVRNGPGLEFAMVGSLAAGTVMQVTGCDADCSWLEVAPSIWIAASQVTPVIGIIQPNGTLFVQTPTATITATPLPTPIPTTVPPTVVTVTPTDVPSVAIQAPQQLQPTSTPTPIMLQAATPTAPFFTPTIVANPTLAPAIPSPTATQPATVAAPSAPTAIYNPSTVGNTQPPLPPVANTTYTVIQGDTLYSLARRYGTTVEAIKAANRLSSDLIYAGQSLLIPSTSAPIALATPVPTATPEATPIPTSTPTPTTVATVAPSPTSTIPPTPVPTSTNLPTPTETPTLTATPSPTTPLTPTEDEVLYVQRVVELTNFMSEAITFIGAQLTALSNNPDLANDLDFKIKTAAAIAAMRTYDDQIRSLSIPPRYLGSGNELVIAANLLDQAMDALVLGLDSRDVAQINLFTQLVTEANAAINRAKAALLTQ